MIGAIEAALGADFARLPSALRAAHRPGREARFAGTATVDAGATWLARRIAYLAGFPVASGMFPITVTMRVVAQGVETWQRRIGPTTLASQLTARGDCLVEEQVGAARFLLRLAPDARGLGFIVASGSIGFVTLPRFLLPISIAAETADGDGFRFDIRITLPVLGHMVRYAGRLVPA